ncbi:uncharacterized protein LOC129584038 [Paramacrobiotus metropolitanus]|uniref:uncharacterized protein LOC129584038 n=1 Tax=Paramacrobiotus metropolitanus TaxID=2943436 RepID=UPI002445D053|nr:uncharacterized protein LOC129584038 [Paramacrobiotus metropolitanus]
MVRNRNRVVILTSSSLVCTVPGLGCNIPSATIVNQDDSLTHCDSLDFGISTSVAGWPSGTHIYIVHAVQDVVDARVSHLVLFRMELPVGASRCRIEKLQTVKLPIKLCDVNSMKLFRTLRQYFLLIASNDCAGTDHSGDAGTRDLAAIQWNPVTGFLEGQSMKYLSGTEHVNRLTSLSASILLLDRPSGYVSTLHCLTSEMPGFYDVSRGRYIHTDSRSTTLETLAAMPVTTGIKHLTVLNTNDGSIFLAKTLHAKSGERKVEVDQLFYPIETLRDYGASRAIMTSLNTSDLMGGTPFLREPRSFYAGSPRAFEFSAVARSTPSAATWEQPFTTNFPGTPFEMQLMTAQLPTTMQSQSRKLHLDMVMTKDSLRAANISTGILQSYSRDPFEFTPTEIHPVDAGTEDEFRVVRKHLSTPVPDELRDIDYFDNKKFRPHRNEMTAGSNPQPTTAGVPSEFTHKGYQMSEQGVNAGYQLVGNSSRITNYNQLSPHLSFRRTDEHRPPHGAAPQAPIQPNHAEYTYDYEDDFADPMDLTNTLSSPETFFADRINALSNAQTVQKGVSPPLQSHSQVPPQPDPHSQHKNETKTWLPPQHHLIRNGHRKNATSYSPRNHNKTSDCQDLKLAVHDHSEYDDPEDAELMANSTPTATAQQRLFHTDNLLEDITVFDEMPRLRHNQTLAEDELPERNVQDLPVTYDRGVRYSNTSTGMSRILHNENFSGDSRMKYNETLAETQYLDNLPNLTLILSRPDLSRYARLDAMQTNDTRLRYNASFSGMNRVQHNETLLGGNRMKYDESLLQSQYLENLPNLTLTFPRSKLLNYSKQNDARINDTRLQYDTSFTGMNRVRHNDTFLGDDRMKYNESLIQSQYLEMVPNYTLTFPRPTPSSYKDPLQMQTYDARVDYKESSNEMDRLLHNETFSGQTRLKYNESLIQPDYFDIMPNLTVTLPRTNFFSHQSPLLTLSLWQANYGNEGTNNDDSLVARRSEFPKTDTARMRHNASYPEHEHPVVALRSETPNLNPSEAVVINERHLVNRNRVKYNDTLLQEEYEEVNILQNMTFPFLNRSSAGGEQPQTEYTSSQNNTADTDEDVVNEDYQYISAPTVSGNETRDTEDEELAPSFGIETLQKRNLSMNHEDYHEVLGPHTTRQRIENVQPNPYRNDDTVTGKPLNRTFSAGRLLFNSTGGLVVNETSLTVPGMDYRFLNNTAVQTLTNSTIHMPDGRLPRLRYNDSLSTATDDQEGHPAAAPKFNRTNGITNREPIVTDPQRLHYTDTAVALDQTEHSAPFPSLAYTSVNRGQLSVGAPSSSVFQDNKASTRFVNGSGKLLPRNEINLETQAVKVDSSSVGVPPFLHRHSSIRMGQSTGNSVYQARRNTSFLGINPDGRAGPRLFRPPVLQTGYRRIKGNVSVSPNTNKRKLQPTALSGNVTSAKVKMGRRKTVFHGTRDRNTTTRLRTTPPAPTILPPLNYTVKSKVLPKPKSRNKNISDAQSTVVSETVQEVLVKSSGDNDVEVAVEVETSESFHNVSSSKNDSSPAKVNSTMITPVNLTLAKYCADKLHIEEEDISRAVACGGNTTRIGVKIDVEGGSGTYRFEIFHAGSSDDNNARTKFKIHEAKGILYARVPVKRNIPPKDKRYIRSGHAYRIPLLVKDDVCKESFETIVTVVLKCS